MSEMPRPQRLSDEEKRQVVESIQFLPPEGRNKHQESLMAQYEWESDESAGLHKPITKRSIGRRMRDAAIIRAKIRTREPLNQDEIEFVIHSMAFTIGAMMRYTDD